MRVLITTIGQWGRIVPILGLVKHLRARGASAWWSTLELNEGAGSQGSCTPGLAAVGEQIHDLGKPAFRDPDITVWRMPEDYASFDELVRDKVLEFRQWAVERMPLFVEYIQRAIRELDIDVLITDSNLSAGTIAARLEGIVCATSTPNLVQLFPPELEDRSGGRAAALRVEPEIRDMVRSFGVALTVESMCCYSDDLNLLPFPRELIQRLGLPLPRVPGLMQVPYYPPWDAPAEPAFPWQSLDERRPLLFGAFGSDGAFPPAAALKLADVAQQLDMQLLLALDSDAIDDLRDQVRPSDVVVRWAPQRALMPRTLVFATHGGANSISEALWAGTPMLLSPMWRDQPVMATLMHQAQLGMHLDLREASISECVACVRRLADPDSPQNRAVKEMARIYRQRNGARDVEARLRQLLAAKSR